MAEINFCHIRYIEMSESKVETYENKSSPSSYGVATIPNLPEYKFVDEIPTNGTGDYVAKTTGTVAVDWEIPSYAFNPSKCRIEFDATTPNNSTDATSQSCCCLADCSPLIKSISLKTVNSEPICEITDYFREFQKLSNPRFQSLKDYLQKDPSDTFHKSDKLATANLTVTTGDSKMTTNASSNYDENLHFEAGTGTGTASSLAQSALSLPFSSMKNTFFGVDKVVYFPKKLKLQVKFGYPQESYFDCKSDGSTATNSTLIGNTTIKNVHLYMCKDENEENAKYLENMVKSQGFKMMIPAVNLEQDIKTGINQILSVDLLQDKGGKIRKIFLAPFNNATTSAPIIMDNNNAVTKTAATGVLTASKVYSYTTSLNSTRLQESDVTIGDATNTFGYNDWKEYRLKHPSGDDAFTSMGLYYYNWAIMHEFDKGLPVVPDISGGMTVIGKDNKFTAKIKASGANTYKWIKMSIYENILVISKDGLVAVLPY